MPQILNGNPAVTTKAFVFVVICGIAFPICGICVEFFQTTGWPLVGADA
jgi:hypothetical protein